jgi:hypothetical protein
MDEKYYKKEHDGYIRRRFTNFNLHGGKHKKILADSKKYEDVGIILSEFDRLITDFDIGDLNDFDLNGLNDIDLDDYIETNTFFCSFNKYQIGDKNVYIVGEIHGQYGFSEDKQQKLISDIEQLLDFRIDIAFFEYALQGTSLGRLFDYVIKKKSVEVIEYDQRIKYFMHKALYHPAHKNVTAMYVRQLLKNYEPMFFKEHYRKLGQEFLKELVKENPNEDKVEHMLRLFGIFLYDMTSLENILSCPRKNILIYCGQEHAKNIGKLIQKNG